MMYTLRFDNIHPDFWIYNCPFIPKPGDYVHVDELLLHEPTISESLKTEIERHINYAFIKVTKTYLRRNEERFYLEVEVDLYG